MRINRVIAMAFVLWMLGTANLSEAFSGAGILACRRFASNSFGGTRMSRTHEFGQTRMSAPPEAVANPAPLISPTGAVDANAPGELAANATVDQILDALDARGKSMHEFTAKVGLKWGDPNVGDESERFGTILLQRTSPDTARVRVQFDKIKVGQVTRDEKTEYLLEDRWLTDRDYRKKIETRREVLKPGQKMDLLKLGEGPFPLPIGQDKAEVHKQFDVSLMPAGKDDPPNSAHLRLKTLPDTPLSQRFKTIDVWVDRKTNFPARIITTARDGSDQHKTTLTNVQINPPGGLKPEDFKLPPINSEWDKHTDAYKE